MILLFLSHPISSPRANRLQKKSTIQSFPATLTATTPVQRIISCLKYCSSRLPVHLEPLFNTVARKILLKPFPPVASLFSQDNYQHSDEATAIWFDVPILTVSLSPLVLPDTGTWDSLLFLKHVQHVPALGPLHWLFPQPRMFFPRYCVTSSPLP